MNHGYRCGQALLMLLITCIVCGCASNKSRDGTDALDLSIVYVGMPRSNFEDLVGKNIEQSQTREHIFYTYKYDRGYIGCLASGRCQEANRTAERWLAVGTLGISEIGTWYEVNKCQVGYLRARYGPEGRLINIRILAPEPYKGGTYLWNKSEPWYPCREVYNHPQPLTLPDAVMDKDVSSKSPE